MSSTMRTPWPSRSAPHHCSASQIDGSAERLAGVDRDVEVLAGHELERVEVTGGREAGLGSGDVEPDDAVVTPPHRELGDLTRPRLSAHGREQRVHRDRMACGGGPLGSHREAVDHRADDVVEPELALGVQLGREPDLGVHDAVGREVLGALGRDPHQRLARLHHRERVVERPRGTAPGPSGSRPRRTTARARRRRSSADRCSRTHRGELDHRRGPHPAVEVVVQQRLGRPRQGVERRAAQRRTPGAACRHRAATSCRRDTRPSPRSSAPSTRAATSASGSARCSAAAGRAAAPACPPESRAAPAGRHRARAAAHRSSVSNSVPPPGARLNSLRSGPR